MRENEKRNAKIFINERQNIGGTKTQQIISR